jgi:RNA polymerase sigma-70 factor (ECF subfamily)
MNRQLVRERERSCDEETILLLNHRRAEYARSLLDVLDARHRLEPLWGYPAVRPVELTRRRMEEIMHRKNMKHSSTPIWCVLAASALAILLIPGAGVPRANAANEEQASTSTARPVTLLKYGDGRADGKKSFGGNGQMIRFELPEGVTSVRGIKIHGSRYGLPQAPDEEFEITFLNEDLDEILGSEAAPYRLFKRGREMWVRVNFAEPIELPQSFWVALNFNAHQTKGVYLSYDTNTKGEYSRVGLAGSDEAPKPTDFGGDWMVQVMLPAAK